MRIEYCPSTHVACLLPIVQQGVGAATVISSLARLVCHIAQKCFSNSSQIALEIEKDKEGLQLGLMRIIPAFGSVISFVILFQLDQAEGGSLFPALAGRISRLNE